jgi:hypothetical protein
MLDQSFGEDAMKTIVPLLAVLLAPFAALAAAPPPHPAPAGVSLMKHPHRPAHFAAPKVLYDQSDFPDGIGIGSQNFEEEFDAYDDEAADDFIVPPGKVWKINQVYVAGTYFGASGPSDSQNIAFYKDRHGLPGKEIARFSGLSGGDTFGSFTIDLPKGVKLKEGHYWISAQSNQSFIEEQQWGWVAYDDQVFNQRAAWRNPNGGFETPCDDWGHTIDCFDYERLGDYKFVLLGKVVE